MISVSKATREDLPAIHHLSAIYGHKLQVEDYHLNGNDIALQARADSGELAGFVWAGLMAKNKVAYIDKVMVNPEYSSQGVLPMLYKELFKIGINRGVKQVFGIIRQDRYHDKAAKAALHMAFGGDALSYTYVYADMSHMISELDAHMVQEAHNG